MSNKPFPFSVCKQCCNGDVSPEQIVQAVEGYFEENPISAGSIGAALSSDLGNVKNLDVGNTAVEGINTLYATKAEKSETVSKLIFEQYIEENGQALAEKAGKSTTLSGYGITDAYTKEEVDGKLGSSGGGSAESILYEDVVNTPEWTNQPTFEGTLDAALNTDVFYYVTLKDSNGSALPSGNFMLKSTFNTDATVYSTVFYLSGLNTGTGTSTQILTENYPVEFTEIGTAIKMRDAGVVSISNNIDKWNLDNGIGKLQVVVHGEFIQRNTNGYFYPQFGTDKNVESYHSWDGTAACQSASTKQIIAYTPQGGTEYKNNRIFDDCILEKNGNGYFSLKRKSVIKYPTNKVKFFDVVGYGNTISSNTNVSSVVFRVNNASNGMIRNGTYIRITEVK